MSYMEQQAQQQIENGVSINMLLQQEIEKLKQENKIFRECLKIAATQLESVSLGIGIHKQNIDVEFFVVEYAKMADRARAILKELEGK